MQWASAPEPRPGLGTRQLSDCQWAPGTQSRATGLGLAGMCNAGVVTYLVHCGEHRGHLGTIPSMGHLMVLSKGPLPVPSPWAWASVPGDPAGWLSALLDEQIK